MRQDSSTVTLTGRDVKHVFQESSRLFFSRHQLRLNEQNSAAPRFTADDINRKIRFTKDEIEIVLEASLFKTQFSLPEMDPSGANDGSVFDEVKTLQPEQSSNSSSKSSKGSKSSSVTASVSDEVLDSLFGSTGSASTVDDLLSIMKQT